MGQGLAEGIASSVHASTARLLDDAAGYLPAIAAAVAVLAMSWAVATLVRRIARFGSTYLENQTRRNLIRQVSYYAVWAVGVFVALDVLGVNTQALVTGLGLSGLALGFALKDILSNLVSGLLILIGHTFEIGDQIIVGDTEGTVERIEVRATHVRTYDGRLVLVPNGEVFTSRVTNNTASPLRRASVSVYLDYRQDLERALSIMLDATTRVADVASQPAASTRLRDLTPELVQLEARFWTDSRRTDFMHTASVVRIAIVSALAKDGIALPSPADRKLTIVEPRNIPFGSSSIMTVADAASRAQA